MGEQVAAGSKLKISEKVFGLIAQPVRAHA